MAHPNLYTGQTKAGKFIPDPVCRAAFLRAFCRKDGTKMKVEVSQIVARRSNNANAYWWGVVIAMFMEELGEHNKYKVHDIVLEAIGWYDERELGGKWRKIVKDTHDLDKIQFGVLIEQARELYREWFSGYIPQPDSEHALSMMGVAA